MRAQQQSRDCLGLRPLPSACLQQSTRDSSGIRPPTRRAQRTPSLVQAMSNVPGNVAAVQELTGHPAFHMTNPNNCYSLFLAFVMSPVNFHAADGSGYAFLVDSILKVQLAQSSAQIWGLQMLQRLAHVLCMLGMHVGQVATPPRTSSGRCATGVHVVGPRLVICAGGQDQPPGGSTHGRPLHAGKAAL